MEKILPDDVIYIAWHANPVVAHESRVAFVHTQGCVVKPVILVSLEKVRKAIGVTKDAVYGRRDALPVVADWTRVAWVYTRKTLIVAIII